MAFVLRSSRHDPLLRDRSRQATRTVAFYDRRLAPRGCMVCLPRMRCRPGARRARRSVHGFETAQSAVPLRIYAVRKDHMKDGLAENAYCSVHIRVGPGRPERARDLAAARTAWTVVRQELEARSHRSTRRIGMFVARIVARWAWTACGGYAVHENESKGW